MKFLLFLGLIFLTVELLISAKKLDEDEDPWKWYEKSGFHYDVNDEINPIQTVVGRDYDAKELKIADYRTGTLISISSDKNNDTNSSLLVNIGVDNDTHFYDDPLIYLKDEVYSIAKIYKINPFTNKPYYKYYRIRVPRTNKEYNYLLKAPVTGPFGKVVTKISSSVALKKGNMDDERHNSGKITQKNELYDPSFVPSRLVVAKQGHVPDDVFNCRHQKRHSHLIELERRSIRRGWGEAEMKYKKAKKIKKVMEEDPNVLALPTIFEKIGSNFPHVYTKKFFELNVSLNDTSYGFDDLLPLLKMSQRREKILRPLFEYLQSTVELSPTSYLPEINKKMNQYLKSFKRSSEKDEILKKLNNKKKNMYIIADALKTALPTYGHILQFVLNTQDPSKLSLARFWNYVYAIIFLQEVKIENDTISSSPPISIKNTTLTRFRQETLFNNETVKSHCNLDYTMEAMEPKDINNPYKGYRIFRLESLLNVRQNPLDNHPVERCDYFVVDIMGRLAGISVGSTLDLEALASFDIGRFFQLNDQPNGDTAKDKVQNVTDTLVRTVGNCEMNIYKDLSKLVDVEVLKKTNNVSELIGLIPKPCTIRHIARGFRKHHRHYLKMASLLGIIEFSSFGLNNYLRKKAQISTQNKNFPTFFNPLNETTTISIADKVLKRIPGRHTTAMAEYLANADIDDRYIPLGPLTMWEHQGEELMHTPFAAAMLILLDKKYRRRSLRYNKNPFLSALRINSILNINSQNKLTDELTKKLSNDLEIKDFYYYNDHLFNQYKRLLLVPSPQLGDGFVISPSINSNLYLKQPALYRKLGIDTPDRKYLGSLIGLRYGFLDLDELAFTAKRIKNGNLKYHWNIIDDLIFLYKHNKYDKINKKIPASSTSFDNPEGINVMPMVIFVIYRKPLYSYHVNKSISVTLSSGTGLAPALTISSKNSENPHKNVQSILKELLMEIRMFEDEGENNINGSTNEDNSSPKRIANRFLSIDWAKTTVVGFNIWGISYFELTQMIAIELCRSADKIEQYILPYYIAFVPLSSIFIPNNALLMVSSAEFFTSSAIFKRPMMLTTDERGTYTANCILGKSGICNPFVTRYRPVDRLSPIVIRLQNQFSFILINNAIWPALKGFDVYVNHTNSKGRDKSKEGKGAGHFPLCPMFPYLHPFIQFAIDGGLGEGTIVSAARDEYGGNLMHRFDGIRNVKSSKGESINDLRNETISPVAFLFYSSYNEQNRSLFSAQGTEIRKTLQKNETLF